MALRGVYEGIYERPAGNYSARYQSQYQDYESFYANPLSLLLLFFVFIVTAVKEGLRKLPEFLSSPPAPPPPHPPEETPPSRRSGTIFTLLFFSLFFSAAENVFPYPWASRAQGIRNWPWKLAAEIGRVLLNAS